MYSTHKAESKHDHDYNVGQKNSYRREKKNDWSCFEEGNDHTSTNHPSFGNLTRNTAGLHTHFDCGCCSKPDVMSQDNCSGHEDIKDKWLKHEFSESYSNMDSAASSSYWQTENIASSDIFNKENENHSTFKHANSDYPRSKGRERDAVGTNSDEGIPESLRDQVHESENIRLNTNNVKDSHCKVDAKPSGKCKGKSKESSQPCDKVETEHMNLDENEEKTLNDDETIDMNKQDLLKHLRKGPKRTHKCRKRHMGKKPGKENIPQVQDMVDCVHAASAWTLLGLGLLKQGFYLVLTVLYYLLVLAVLSGYTVICWIGTHVKWICVSVMSKAGAIIADVNAFSRQRWRTYEPSERERSARRTSSAQQTFDEENLEADEVIPHLLSSKNVDAYSVLRVTKQANDDEIKRKYRAMAKIVHPDKNPNQNSSAAFQVLQSAFEKISDQEKRMAYHFESDKRKFEEEFESFIDIMTSHSSGFFPWVIFPLESSVYTRKNATDLLQPVAPSGLIQLKSKIMCTNCNKTHPRLVTNRLVSAARYCARCDARHSVKEGDVWVETSHMGFKYYCYICLDNVVYEVTEWGSCQGLLINNRANTHGVYLSVKSNRPTPWDDLFGDSDQPTQPQQNKKKRHKNKAKGGSKNKKR